MPMLLTLVLLRIEPATWRYIVTSQRNARCREVNNRAGILTWSSALNRARSSFLINHTVSFPSRTDHMASATRTATVALCA